MQKITSLGRFYITICLIAILILQLSCKSRRMNRDLYYEDQILIYQKNQFYNPDLNYVKRYIPSFKKMNRELLMNRDSDSFWVVLCFNEKLFMALYLSNKDTIIYSLSKDSIIERRNELAYIRDFSFLIDSIVQKKKMPFASWSGTPILYIASKINLKMKNIVQGGFNVHNFEIIERF